MRNGFDIAIPPAVILRGIVRDGDRAYLRAKEVEKYLQQCYPKLKIGGLKWDMERISPLDSIELKIEILLPEEIRKLGEEIKEKASTFLRTLG